VERRQGRIVSAARAALRRPQRQQREAERACRPAGPTVVTALPIPDALRDPTWRRPVAEALLAAALVASTGEDAEHGSECFCCGRSWTMARTCRMAVLGTGRRSGAGFVAFACGECCGDDHRAFVERVKATLRDVMKLEGVRELSLAPGGHA
jgi:hypothetical protein